MPPLGQGLIADTPIPPTIAPRSSEGIGFTHLALTDFRAYRELRLDLDSAVVVLTGANGAGKTHILEALSLFAPGSGLLRARIDEIGFRQASNRASSSAFGAAGLAASGPAWAVHARYRTRKGEWSLGTGRDPLAPAASGRERRLCRINGAPAKSQAAFAEILSLIWLAPAMDSLLREAASSRRRFLDRLTSGLDPAHAARVADYDFALRERARLLRGEGPAQSAATHAAWIEALEGEMAAHAVAIAAARREAIAELNAAMRDMTGPFPQAELAAAGAIEDWLADLSALAAEEKLRLALAEARVSDAESGITRWGTHRSDLDVRYRGRRLGEETLPAASASTGEQKALLLAILIAEARLCAGRRGEMPVLLLDEVAAHLDAERRRALFAEILALDIPCWLTGADADCFRPLSGHAQFLAAADGRVIPMAH